MDSDDDDGGGAAFFGVMMVDEDQRIMVMGEIFGLLFAEYSILET